MIKIGKAKSLLLMPFVIFLSVAFSGCIYLLVGGVAAVGGYAVSGDTIQGETDKSFDEIWENAVDVVSIMGAINSESYDLGHISAIVNGARVDVTVAQLTSSTVRLAVKARKAIFPSKTNAERVFIKIMNRATE